MLDDAELSQEDELLFRQVSPGCVDANGQPSSQSFRPTKKDNYKLSVDRSSLTTAKKSHSLYQKNGYESVAVYGLTVGEFKGEKIPCVKDPIVENPAHALADYNGNKNQHKHKAKRLKDLALKRGELYSPPPAADTT